MPAIINLENVSWTYRGAQNRALDHINLAIEEGECIAVMGENGAGKTTFCRLLNGLIPHSLPGKLTGTVTVDGILTSSATVPRLAQRVGMVFEDPQTQLFTARAEDEVAFALENMLLPPDAIREKVCWALDAVGLSAYAGYAPAALSGGQQQRLAIAAALAMAAKVLVLDDPASQLDPAGAREIFSLIGELSHKTGLTVVMAAGCGKDAAGFADRICVMKKGSVDAFDTPQKIFAERHFEEILTVGRANRHKQSGTIQSSAVIQISNLYYQYYCGNMILADVNLTVAENEFAVIMGPNGCGKTTLLKNISGLLRPSQGTILLRGRDTAGMGIADIAGEIGFVMQDPDRQLFGSAVYDEVAFALKRTVPKNEMNDKVEKALSMVGLLGKRDAFPPALNRADRVKTVFAAVLAMGPKIIMLDEPFAGQDMAGCRLITDILASLHQQGYTILLVTHNIGIIAGHAQRIIELRKR